MSMEAIEALIEQTKREGYDDNRAFSDRLEVINLRRAEIDTEFQALNAEQQRLNDEYVKRERERRAQLDAWAQALSTSSETLSNTPYIPNLQPPRTSMPN